MSIVSDNNKRDASELSTGSVKILKPAKASRLETSADTSVDEAHTSSRKADDLTISRRLKFVAPLLQKPKRIPKARELGAISLPDTLPNSLATKFDGVSTFFAFDIETHDIIREETRVWSVGKYGFQSRVGSQTLETLRIVQIGWALGAVEDPMPQTFVRMVKPNGFKISQEAISKHRILQSEADTTGEALASALQDMMNSVREFCGQGARLVAHQLEFDAGIIAEELGRCGLNDLKAYWEETARKGICTMDPEIAVWIREVNCIKDYRDDKPISPNVPLGLVDATRLLVPNSQSLCRQHHAADKDATMTWLLCRALAKRCPKPSE